MLNFLWWLALVLTAYFGFGIVMGIWHKAKITAWAVLLFIVSLVFVLSVR